MRAGSEAAGCLVTTYSCTAFAIAVPYFSRVSRRHRLFSSDILVDSRELVPLVRIRDTKNERGETKGNDTRFD